jgi:branched-chain amino acid transport system permease protein
MIGRLVQTKYFLLFLFFLLLFLFFRDDSYIIYLLIMIFIGAATALTAIVPIGPVGQLVLCQGAFWGLGAYVYALLIKYYALSPWLCLPAATFCAGVVGLGIACTVIRTRGIYLGIVTLSFGVVFQLVLVNLNSITGGTSGLNTRHFPAISLAGYKIDGGSDTFYYFFTLIAFLAIMGLLEWLMKGKVGISLRCIKQDETAAKSIGINFRFYHLLSFFLTACIGGFAGGVFASYQAFISPTLFVFESTLSIILSGVVGGITRLSGSIVGAAFVVLFPELLRFLADYRVTIYGLSLVVLLIFLPEGLTPLFEKIYHAILRLVSGSRRQLKPLP